MHTLTPFHSPENRNAQTTKASISSTTQGLYIGTREIEEEAFASQIGS